MGLAISNFNKRLILISLIQLSGGHCTKNQSHVVVVVAVEVVVVFNVVIFVVEVVVFVAKYDGMI